MSDATGDRASADTRALDETTADPRDGGSDQGSALLGHLYRGEMSRANTWRQRLDATTNWAVVLSATVLTWVFSSRDHPHYVLLMGMLAVGLFLVIESRRYRSYDVWRSRVRLLEENLFTRVLGGRTSGSVGGEEGAAWRRELADDLRRPTLKISLSEAVSRRLRRVYVWILTLLLLAWVVRVAVFKPAGVGMLETMRIEHVPGTWVLGFVAGLYGLLYALVLWPRRRQAKGRLRDEPGEYGDWIEEEEGGESEGDGGEAEAGADGGEAGNGQRGGRSRAGAGDPASGS